MKKLMLIVLLALGGQAQAAVLDDFTWTTDTGIGDGSVNFLSPTAVTITGSNSGLFLTPPPVRTSIETTATSNGTVTFDWGFSDANLFAGANFFLWLSDGVDATELLATGNAASAGSASFLVAAGNTFGMAVDAAFDGLGAATASITNFNFAPSGQPEPVPAPATLLLFGTALAGFVFTRRKKRES